MSDAMTRRFAYADPPYPGQSRKHYKDHPDYAGEVDHIALARQLREFDGWVLHTSAPAIFYVQSALTAAGFVAPDPIAGVAGDYRIMAWVKPFAAFKRNVPVAYTWEPMFVRTIRKPVVAGRVVMRDYIEHADDPNEYVAVRESITMKRGLSGAKPERVCQWVFEIAGLQPSDEFHDLFPGTGAVARAHETWSALWVPAA